MLSFASAECWEMSASSLSSSSSNNHLGLCPSLKMEERGKVVINEKQGIVSILGSDCERAKAASLRRTLSADMSSKKWLAQHGFSSSSLSSSPSSHMMRKIASSQQFPTTTTATHASSSPELGKLDDDDHSCGAGPGISTFQTWSSILSQNEEPAGAAKPATCYVHPLLKRSSASLSDKSLQICTESLGSETGSDGFSSSSSSSSSPPPSPNTLQEELYQLEHEKEEEYSQSEMENYYPLVRKRLQPPSSSSSSFPPPLPSLSATQAPYNNVRFQTHRQDGRLVLEAVSVPTQNYFQAHRHEGRLILTWAATTSPFSHQRMTHQDEADQEFDSSGENETQLDAEDGEAAAGGKKGMEMEAVPKLPTGMMSVHRSALMMKKKLMGLVNINPAWPPKLNEATQLLAPAPTPRVARMITTPPTAGGGAAAPSSFNAYEYCWRSKPPTASAVFKGSKAHEQQQLLLLRGNKAEYYSVPLLRGCKEPRRSLLIWEPHCIATS